MRRRLGVVYHHYRGKGSALLSFWAIEEQDIGDGERVGLWVRKGYRLPRINDEFLNCAVYLYDSRNNAEGGVQSGGSGFFVGVAAESPEPLTATSVEDYFRLHIDAAPLGGRRPRDQWGHHPHLYIVTNRHVARECHYVRITKQDGTSDVIEVENWVSHLTSDLAVSPVAWDKMWHLAYQFAMVQVDIFLSPNELKELDVGVGDDTFCVGRFISHDGKQRNLPVARFGPISMMPHEPVDIKGEGNQNCFLIESRIIQGYSGSPVFLSIPPWELQANAEDTLRYKLGMRLGEKRQNRYKLPYLIRLLGIVTAFLKESLDPRQPNTGMMAVVPAWELLELLNQDDLRNQRREQLVKWKKSGDYGNAFPA